MALILTRKLGRANSGYVSLNATLRIGEDVTITIIGIKGNNVRVAVEAPNETAIWREELYQELRQKTPAGTPVPTHANR
jgi:carbon storage regulator